MALASSAAAAFAAFASSHEGEKKQHFERERTIENENDEARRSVFKVRRGRYISITGAAHIFQYTHTRTHLSAAEEAVKATCKGARLKWMVDRPALEARVVVRPKRLVVHLLFRRLLLAEGH